MAENNIKEPSRPPVPTPRTETTGPLDDEIYEQVDSLNVTPFSHQDFHPLQSPTPSPSPSETYISVSEFQGNLNEYENDTIKRENLPEPEGSGQHLDSSITEARRDSQYNYEYCNDYCRLRQTSNPADFRKKTDLFKRSPKEFLDAFESTRDEMRTDEETFIILHLLKENESSSPVLDGDLEQLALLACRSSPHVVKRALDALLNEIFLSISDFSRIRCRNILEAEKIIRESCYKSLKVEHVKAKCRRMTTYAWLITFVLLKCTGQNFVEIATGIREFDRTLQTLPRENKKQNTFGYGIVLARESIKRILLACRKNVSKESLHSNLERCDSLMNSELRKEEVMTFGKTLYDNGSWLDLHICLVFLQDLPKLHRFHGNLKPVILIQMLIQDYRDRCSARQLQKLLNISNPNSWKFEILVYHVILRLIRTSKSKAIIEQVLISKQGVFTNCFENKSQTWSDYSLVALNLVKICQRAVFRAPPICFKRLMKYTCKGDPEDFIERLSILQLRSKYKDKVFDVLQKSEVPTNNKRVRAYDVHMNAKKYLLKLYRHNQDDLLDLSAQKSVCLREEIKIVKIINAQVEPCPNIVRMIGSSTEAPIHMITESGSTGDLLTFLKNHKVKEVQNLIQIARDICSAMLFLYEQNIIHRDLRAENCFVFFHDGKSVTKLGNFHLAALDYSCPKSPTSPKHQNNPMNQPLPNEFSVPWMAVETLQFDEFSTASDVWSYGVLLFEIFTFGCQPYVNMPSGLSLNSDEDVREYVINGGRLELHPRIPESIQVLIQLTMVDVDYRPTFPEIRDNLSELTSQNVTFADSAYFDVSHAPRRNPLVDNIAQPIRAGAGGCVADGCFGECLKKSDVAEPINVDNSNFIKEFIPASSRDILRLSELEYPTLAIITHKIFHDEKLELITEVGDMGNLKQFINAFGCSMENAMRYLSQIGEAVSFLHLRRFIHRNLRANAVFVYLNGNAKLACFSRVRKQKPNADDQSSSIPINLPMPDDSLRWSSPEVITDGEYSKGSDMWAFGVLIWEMFSLIEKVVDESDKEITPYQELTSKGQILSYLQEEKRLGKPNNCPDWLYKMMLRCWENNTQDRVKVEDIVQCINDKILRGDHTSLEVKEVKLSI